MSAVDPVGAAGFLARYEGLRDRLPGDRRAREAAAEAFRRIGLPGRRDEAWKYTNLRALNEAAFHESTRPPAIGYLVDELESIPGYGRVIFANGRLKSPPDTFPRSFTRFSEKPEFAFDRENTAFSALNSMLALDGSFIDVPLKEVSRIQIASFVHDRSKPSIDAHLRHIIRVGEGASLDLFVVERGRGSYLQNTVYEIELKENAQLRIVRLQDDAQEAFSFSMIQAKIASGARYDSFVLNVGARIGRSETHVLLSGEHASATVGGAQLLAGSQTGDITTVIRHEAPRCASRQTVKNVLTGRARGVFQGRIEVARAAQKTDGYQMSQALLLSPDAEIDTKPELEIFADDVKCSHGATVGELDPEQVFYLRSRGVPEAEARTMLVRAFLAEALEAVTHDATRAAMEAAMELWWQRQAA